MEPTRCTEREIDVKELARIIRAAGEPHISGVGWRAGDPKES